MCMITVEVSLTSQDFTHHTHSWTCSHTPPDCCPCVFGSLQGVCRWVWACGDREPLSRDRQEGRRVLLSRLLSRWFSWSFSRSDAVRGKPRQFALYVTFVAVCTPFSCVCDAESDSEWKHQCTNRFSHCLVVHSPASVLQEQHFGWGLKEVQRLQEITPISNFTCSVLKWSKIIHVSPVHCYRCSLY